MEWVVCELSSFQLEDVHELACDVAVLLNLEPDHLDRHGSFEAYRDAKLRIFERARAKIVPAGSGLEGIAFSAEDELPAEPLLRGAHNRENAAAATAAARAAGISDEHIAAGLRTFPGVPHRLELVAERDGVRFVNDSKATNVAAARRALAAYADEPVHLIAGGSGKGEDFAPLAAAVGPNVRSIHLIGDEAERLAAALPGAHVDGDLAAAVAHGAETAEPGDVVLLSPACASFDQFANFEARGEAFRQLVAELGRAPHPGLGLRGHLPNEARMKRGELDSRLLILVTLALVAFGLVMVYSATSASATVGGNDPELLPEAAGDLRRTRDRPDGGRAALGLPPPAHALAGARARRASACSRPCS